MTRKEFIVKIRMFPFLAPIVIVKTDGTRTKRLVCRDVTLQLDGVWFFQEMEIVDIPYEAIADVRRFTNEEDQS